MKLEKKLEEERAQRVAQAVVARRGQSKSNGRWKITRTSSGADKEPIRRAVSEPSEEQSKACKEYTPIQENSIKNGYVENNDNNMSDETKCETNYSINNKWNNTRNKHLTKHDTNDDVDLDNRVVHTVR